MAHADPPASVEGSNPLPFRVEDAVRIAVQNNPRLLAAAGFVRAAREGVRGAESLTNPSFSVVLPTSTGGADEVFLFQQPLEINGTRSARAGIAKAGLKEREAQALSSLRTLVFETKVAYYELVRAESLNTLTADLVQNVQELDRATRRLAELGSRPGIERAQTGIELSRARQQLTVSESQVVSARAVLNRLLGRLPDAPIGPLESLNPSLESVAQGEEVLVREALQRSAEVQLEEATQEGYKQQARLARAKGRPDVAPQLRAQRFRADQEDIGFGLAITLPIFDYGSRRSEARQADDAARAQSYRILDAQSQVRQEVSQAISRLQAARSVVDSYQQGVLGDAKKLLDANRIGVEAGAYNLLTVLEAQRTYRSIQTDYLSALTSLALARAELERVTGQVPENLPGSLKETK